MDRLARVALALALLATSCVQFQWSRELTYAPVDAARIASVKPGENDLGECLSILGAPLFVWEYRGDGVAIVYGAQRDKGLGVGVSVPISDQNSVSFDYDQGDAAARGCVLFFDGDWKLVALREGRLRDLFTYRRQPPAPVLDD